MAQQPMTIEQFAEQHDTIVTNHAIEAIHTPEQADEIRLSRYYSLTQLFTHGYNSGLVQDDIYAAAVIGFRQWLRNAINHFPSFFPYFLHSRHCNAANCRFQQIPSNSPYPIFQCSEIRVDENTGQNWDCSFRVEQIISKPRRAINANVVTFPLSIFKCTMSLTSTNPLNAANNRSESWAAKLSDLTPNDGICDDAIRETSSYLLLGKDNHPNMMRIHSYETLHIADIHYQSTPWACYQSLDCWVGTHIIAHPQLYAFSIKPIVLSLLRQLDYLHNASALFHGDIKSENIFFDENHNAYLVDFGMAQPLIFPHRPPNTIRHPELSVPAAKQSYEVSTYLVHRDLSRVQKFSLKYTQFHDFFAQFPTLRPISIIINNLPSQHGALHTQTINFADYLQNHPDGGSIEALNQYILHLNPNIRGLQLDPYVQYTISLQDISPTDISRMITDLSPLEVVKLGCFTGTVPFAAQEVFSHVLGRSNAYDPRPADIYCLGTAFYLLFFGYHIYRNHKELALEHPNWVHDLGMQNWRNNTYQGTLLSEDLLNLLTRMLRHNPAGRPDVKQLIATVEDPNFDWTIQWRN